MTEYRSLDGWKSEIEANPGKMVFESPKWAFQYFVPFFRADGHWWGKDDKGAATSIPIAGEQQWKPHVPAPPKVKRWRWLVIPNDRHYTPYETNNFYVDEQQAAKDFINTNEGATFHRLDETEREFPF